MSASVHGLMSITEQSAHFLSRDHQQRPPGAVHGDSAWRGADFSDPHLWIETLGADIIEAFEATMSAAQDKGLPLDDLTLRDVEMTARVPALQRWRDTLTHGRGFLVLRGVPVDRWDLDTQKLFMRVLGLQFGRLGYQNPQGDVIGEVRDTGADKRDPFARLYATAGEFRFHCDASDLVGLLCVRPAAEGGQSKVASSVTVYNELLRRRPDLAARMFEPMALDLRNEQQPDAPPVAYIAPCAYADGVLKTLYLSDYFRTAARHSALPPEDLELLDLYDAIADEPGIGLSFFLEPGDVQILYNHTMLHARTAFRDAPGQERLLLRFLVSVGVAN
ncbi:MAG: TauD/TfdA family dioxygenase [Phenylobacterium sp.]